MAVEPAPDEALALASIAILLKRDAEVHSKQSDDPHSPWSMVSGWRLNADNRHDVRLIDADVVRQVVLHFRRDGYEVEMPGGHRLKATQVTFQNGVLSAVMNDTRVRSTVVFDGLDLTVLSGGDVWRLTLSDPIARADQQKGGSGRLIAPMPGAVIAVLVAEGDTVERDQALMVIEAMKMEHTIRAAVVGRIAKVHFVVGQQVNDGDELLTSKCLTASRCWVDDHASIEG